MLSTKQQRTRSEHVRQRAGTAHAEIHVRLAHAGHSCNCSGSVDTKHLCGSERWTSLLLVENWALIPELHLAGPWPSKRHQHCVLFVALYDSCRSRMHLHSMHSPAASCCCRTGLRVRPRSFAVARTHKGLHSCLPLLLEALFAVRQRASAQSSNGGPGHRGGDLAAGGSASAQHPLLNGLHHCTSHRRCSLVYTRAALPDERAVTTWPPTSRCRQRSRGCRCALSGARRAASALGAARRLAGRLLNPPPRRRRQLVPHPRHLLAATVCSQHQQHHHQHATDQKVPPDLPIGRRCTSRRTGSYCRCRPAHHAPPGRRLHQSQKSGGRS